MQIGSLVTPTIDYHSVLGNGVNIVPIVPQPGDVFTCTFVGKQSIHLLETKVVSPEPKEFDPEYWVEVLPPGDVNIEDLIEIPAEELAVLQY